MVYRQRLFVLDSGFCILQAIVKLKKRGLFAAALIKKWRYLTGLSMFLAMKSLYTLTTKMWEMLTQSRVQMDGVPFHIHAMKEPDYIMMLMSTYGTTLKMGVTKRQHYTVEGGGGQKSGRVSIYKFCDMILTITTHSGCIQSPMEEIWMTMRWANHMFCFLLTITICQLQNCSYVFSSTIHKLDVLQSQ